MSRTKGALNIDKALHTVFEEIGHLKCFQPYGEYGRYLTYYAEERLYFVFDLWYHGFFLVEADSPKDAIEKVNCDKLAYLPKEEEDLHTIKETLIKQEAVADDLEGE